MTTLDGPDSSPATQVLELQQRLAEQGEENAALRLAAQEHAQRADLVEQLREANQNLLLATLNAQALREASDAAKERQNEFLAMLAHELRNPLAPISMASTLLSNLPGASREALELHSIIERQVMHLSRLLDDLLDAARISSGKISLARRPMSLVDLIKRTIDTVQVRLLARSQVLKVSLPESLPINGDPVRLAQVFSNLLVNASKFTQDGGTISVVALVVDNKAIIHVRDNGMGMEADVLPHIFSLFTQGPRSLARAEGGLGVGLNVVQNIVQQHGGSVTASSGGPDLGSQFTVVLPLSAPVPLEPETVHPLAPKTRSQSRRILLVEDNVDANATLCQFLEGEGHRVTSVHDGISGLALAQARTFDILICDIGLPGIDGLQLLQQLRESASQPIPFAIAVSGYGDPDKRMRAIGAGYGKYFVKPVDVDALLALIGSDAVCRSIDIANAKR
jgi:signal transduction histidine kinase/CheY-like chemotaxis protein